MWELVRWVHLLAMAFFVGGQVVLAVAVVPALRGADRASLRAIARRFALWTLGALVLLVATGVAMASHFGDWDRTALHVKLALVVIVGALIAAHARWPERHALEAAVFVVTLAIVWLGVALSH